MSEPKKRHLPVVSTPPVNAEAEPEESAVTKAWQWVAFGAVLVFAAWLPLAVVAQKVSDALVARALGAAATREEIAARVATMHGGALASLEAALAVPHAVALALAASTGGFVMARFGGSSARAAALAGAVVGLVASALAIASSAASWALAVVVALASAFAALGGALGRARARRARP